MYTHFSDSAWCTIYEYYRFVFTKIVFPVYIVNKWVIKLRKRGVVKFKFTYFNDFGNIFYESPDPWDVIKIVFIYLLLCIMYKIHMGIMLVFKVPT